MGDFDEVEARPSEYVRITEALMRDAIAKGWTLEKLSDKKVMNRSIRTLQMRARQFGLSFPDYTPRALRNK